MLGLDVDPPEREKTEKDGQYVKEKPAASPVANMFKKFEQNVIVIGVRKDGSSEIMKRPVKA